MTMTTRDLDGAAHVAACRDVLRPVKARVWRDTTWECWFWSCWSCETRNLCSSWADAYRSAVAHVSFWHRGGRMPATATTLPEYEALDEETDK